jgi:transcriptional regulator with XRE-family HTH domain
MIVLKNIPALSERLKYIRAMRDLSQIELAEIAGTTQQAIQQAETGKARNPRYLHKISLALDIPYEWLTMNIQPPAKLQEVENQGLSERRRDVLDSFFGMSKKEQELMLGLMKTRQKKQK